MDDEPNVLLKAAEAPQGRRSALAIASFIAANLSPAGLLLGNVAPGLVYLFLFFAPALVTGHLARRAFRKHPGAFTNEAMATYGFIGVKCWIYRGDIAPDQTPFALAAHPWTAVSKRSSAPSRAVCSIQA